MYVNINATVQITQINLNCFYIKCLCPDVCLMRQNNSKVVQRRKVNVVLPSAALMRMKM